jgi:LuxR family transcriptional regulator
MKDCTRDDLQRAAAQVLDGEEVFPETPAPVEEEVLTARQVDVLQRVAAGQRPKQVARTLGLSERTVNNHLAACHRRLGVSTRLDAVIAAKRLGYLNLNN